MRDGAPVLVISNHVHTLGMTFPPDSFVRINLAWMPSMEAVEKVIEKCPNPIFLDFPTGRTKRLFRHSR